MATVSIDTHKTINNLVAKGFTQQQAEGVIDALTESALVTKDDLRVAVAEMKTWVAILLIGQAGLIVAIQTLFNM